jgi:hypothetical protein
MSPFAAAVCHLRLPERPFCKEADLQQQTAEGGEAAPGSRVGGTFCCGAAGVEQRVASQAVQVRMPASPGRSQNTHHVGADLLFCCSSKVAFCVGGGPHSSTVGPWLRPKRARSLLSARVGCWCWWQEMVQGAEASVFLARLDFVKCVLELGGSLCRLPCQGCARLLCKAVA